MHISRSEMAKRLRKHKPEVVSTEDFCYKESRYLIHFDLCSFYVVDSNLQYALDKLADYLYMKEYFGFFYCGENPEEEAPEDLYMIAGNFCHRMQIPVLVEEAAGEEY